MCVCSLVIRAYNEEQHIGRLLTGVLQQTVRDVEIVVVDSGSDDATVAIASRFPVRIVTISPHEFSFGRSLNIGCEATRGDYLIFASAHVYPLYRDWLERLIEPFDNPRVAMSYGKQRGNESTRYAEQRLFERWFPEESVTVQEQPFCNNANAAIRRSTWTHYRYNESLTGLEDLDMAKRLLSNGHCLSYAAEAVVAHVHDETSRQVLNRYRREAIALREIFPDQKFSLSDFVRLFTVNTISDLRHASHNGRMFQEARGIAAFRFLQFWGTYLGFRKGRPVSESLRRRFYYPNAVAGARPARAVASRDRVDYSQGPAK